MSLRTQVGGVRRAVDPEAMRNLSPRARPVITLNTAPRSTRRPRTEYCKVTPPVYPPGFRRAAAMGIAPNPMLRYAAGRAYHRYRRTKRRPAAFRVSLAL